MPAAQAARDIFGEHPKSVTRKILKGRTINGRTIRLGAVKIGKRWYVTPQSCREFLRAVTEAELAPYAGDPDHASDDAADVDHAEAERELSEMGI
jgi:hypothetical protein